MINLELDTMLEIINTANPLGLYEDDATNRDEFISEAKEIIKRIDVLDKSRIPTQEEIHKLVSDVFQSFFEGVEIKREDLGQIAKNLHSAISTR